MIGSFLSERLGRDKVTQRDDGILAVVREEEAYAIQG